MAQFSIILPVRNGGHYLKECIQSLEAQTYRDFQVVVLENASTDGTAEWLQTLPGDRYIILPAERPLSIEENWARILAAPKNELITLIGHDDILYPDFLEKINNLVQQYPGASLYHTHFHFIDAQGNIKRSSRPMAPEISGAALLEGFLTGNIDSMGTGYVMRAADYNRVGGIPVRYPNLLFADFELWLQLAAIGGMVVHPDHCFAFRVHQSTTGTSRNSILFRALDEYVQFLLRLKSGDSACASVINTHGSTLLAVYSRSLAHRVLRTAPSMREGISVMSMLEKVRRLASLLVPSAPFEPEKQWSVRLALWIDRIPPAGWLFRLFKKAYTKPIL